MLTLNGKYGFTRKQKKLFDTVEIAKIIKPVYNFKAN